MSQEIPWEISCIRELKATKLFGGVIAYTTWRIKHYWLLKVKPLG